MLARIIPILCLLPCALTAGEDPIFQSFHNELIHVGLVIDEGDFNEDGHLDLAARVNGKVRLFPGNGDGTFIVDEANDLSGLGSRDLVMEDMNSDGHLDLVGTGGPAVFISLGNGDGTFGPSQSYATAFRSAQVVVGDLNRDFIPDVAVGNERNRRVHVLLGKGDGTLHPEITLGPVGESPRSVAMADFDGDKLPDLAFGNFQESHVSLIFNMGSGNYSAPSSLTTAPNPQALATGDLNEDGDADLVVNAGGGLQVFLGNGDGSFATPPVTIGLGSLNPDVDIVDFDEDGHQDLAAPSGSGWFAVVTGNGDGTFQTPRFYNIGDSAYRLVPGDFNSDGEVDFASVDFAFDGMTLALGRGDGTFGPHYRTGAWPVDVKLIDLDGNGKLDVVTANENADSVSVMMGLGNGWFSQTVDYDAGPDSKPSVLVTGEFTGDGETDLATASSGLFGGKVTVLPGNGDGTFGSPILHVVGNDLRDLDVGDLNKDGVHDLVTVSSGLRLIYVLIGLENGGFLPPEQYSTWLSPNGVTIGDFDEDTFPDIVSGHDVGTDSLQFHLNRGDSTFAPGIPIDTDYFNQRVRSVDLNNDQHLDLVTSAVWSQGLVAYLGNGDGTFSDAIPNTVTWNPNRFDFGDVNNDGFLDVVVAQQYLFFDEGGVAVLIGNGDGTFEPPVTFGLMDDTYSVAVGDIDNDGVDDLAAAVTDSWTVSILRSRRGPWDDLGHHLAGSFGIPHQTGEGSLTGGELFRFSFSDGKPFSSLYHIIGLSQVDLPFKGGTLVPSGEFITGPFPLGGQGQFSFEAAWPAGVPPMTELYFQFWFQDSGAPMGFAASNALRGTTP